MESGLLNTFHDDHFDGNYVKYETDSSLWSDGTESIGLQLTETLHGILPTSLSHDKMNYYENEIEVKNTYRIKQEMNDTSINLPNYYKNDINSSNQRFEIKYEPMSIKFENSTEVQDECIVTQYIPAEEFYNSMNTMSPSVEVISVDPNCEFQSPLSEDESDSDSEADDGSNNSEEDESTSSNETSDNSSSTSMSDYESHSSDEESDKNEANRIDIQNENVYPMDSVKMNNDNLIVNNIPNHVLTEDHHKPKKRPYKKSLSLPLSPVNGDFTKVLNYNNYSLDGIEANEIATKLNSSIETYQTPLEAEIDEQHFDLATFITQDDDEFHPEVLSNQPPKDLFAPNPSNLCGGYKLQTLKTENFLDYDTDEDIDVETVHDNPVIIDDDPIRDPSWSPSRTKNTRPSRINTRSKARSNSANNKPIPQKQEKTKTNPVSQANRGTKKPTQSTETTKQKQSNTGLMKKAPVCFSVNRKKFGIGKGGKNISMCSKPEVSDQQTPNTKNGIKKADDKINKSAATNKIGNSIKKESNTKPSVTIQQEHNKTAKTCHSAGDIKTTKSMEKPSVKTIGNTPNNKSSIKPEKQDTNFERIENAATIEINQKCEDNELTGEVQVKIEEETVKDIEEVNPVVQPIKKKLNLEEYKRRRELQTTGAVTDSSKSAGVVKNVPMMNANHHVHQSVTESIVNNVNVSNSISSTNKIIVGKNVKPNGERQHSLLLKNYVPPQKNGPKFYDPILEAKNKVLRMQELKKAARTKLIDVTVSSKVGPVTAILPLEQITSMGKNGNENGNAESDKKSLKINPDYEEIIIVSAGSNTDITIPPVFEKLPISVPEGNNSSSLLLNINDTIQKASMCGESVKISSNSLISSIQDVVLKKSGPDILLASSNTSNTSPFHKSPNVGVSPPSQFSPEKPEMSKTAECIKAVHEAATGTENNNSDIEKTSQKEHGEDKIIMHLRKDRIRKKTISISTQTDFLTQFPALKLLHVDIRSTKLQENYHQDKSRRKQSRNYRSRRTASYSSDDGDSKSRSRSNRTLSPRSRCKLANKPNDSNQANKRKTTSNHCKSQKRSRSRSLSRSNAMRRRTSRSHSQSSSSSYSDRTEKRSRSRSNSRGRHIRRRNYSRSPSSQSSYRSKSRSRSRSSQSTSTSRSKTHFRRSRSRSRQRRHERLSSPAVEERRIVYVGRIERDTSKEDLKRKFISYGPIRKITIHYKDNGMKYGFVTFERAQDAFKSIDNALRDPKISMYDVSFGGRRAFCRATYSDLDHAATNCLQGMQFGSGLPRGGNEDESFEALLQKVKKKISATKSAASSPRSVKT